MHGAHTPPLTTLITNQVEPLVAIEQLNGMLQRGQIGAYKYDMLFVKVWAKALDERGDAPFTTMENRRTSNAKTPPSRRLSEIVRAVFRHTGRSASGDFPGLRAALAQVCAMSRACGGASCPYTPRLTVV